jgi:hypothetical protein
LTQLHSSATAASFDFGLLRGRVDRALCLSLERFEAKKIEPGVLRVMGLSCPASGSGANQQMGPSTSPNAAVQVASREEDLAPLGATGRALRGKKT